jgi:chorismate mutase/prephenate dehydratase
MSDLENRSDRENRSDLENLRRRIDEVDRRIVDLLADRLKIASAIGREKEAAGLSLYDPDRERKVLERVGELAAGEVPPAKLAAIFREIISASRGEEMEHGVLVHGVWGSLAHHAAVLRFGAAGRYEVTSRGEDIFARLADGSCAYAVISLEGQSLESSLDRLDLFFHTSAGIFGEFYIRPRLDLYGTDAPPGTVFSTPSAVVQASRWIERRSDDLTVHVVGTAQEAVRRARETGGGVLGYPVLATLEDLSCLEAGIEDLPELTRRFLVLSKHEARATGDDKTSLLAVIANRPGALHRVMGILAGQGINLCWIEPKATHVGHWDHLFVLEIQGHREEENVAEALRELRQELEFLKVLGSYKSEKPPERPF